MAIDRIPGVGPQNSDIAAAVAAPSAATIASTVAGSVPTLAQINTAVNTQTNNSAIATAVAGAVPTLAQITSTVQANAGSPFGGTYTNLGTTSFNATTITISSLSSYKFIAGYVTCNMGNGDGSLSFRFNNDSGNNYSYQRFSKRVTNPPIEDTDHADGTTSLAAYYDTALGGTTSSVYFEIYGSNSSAYKRINIWGRHLSASQGTNRINRIQALYLGTSAISSMSFIASASGVSGNIRLIGAA
jgi:hypothetical protein